MTKYKTGTREEWLAARLGLLKEEKELTRRSDELAQRGRSYRGSGSTRCIDSRLTRGAPRWRTSSEGARSSSSTTSCSGPTTRRVCPACSAVADGFNGFVVHLANHDVMLWAVSRAPLREAAGVQAADGVDVSLGVLVAFERLQLRLQRLVHRGTGARGGRRIQLPARGGVAGARGFREWRRGGPEVRGHVRNRHGHVHAREAGYECVRARGRRRLPHLFRLCARTGRPLGHVSMARPRPQGPQRDGRLVAPPR